MLKKALKVAVKETAIITGIAVVIGVLFTGGLYWAAKQSGWV